MARRPVEPFPLHVLSLVPGGLGRGLHEERPVVVRGAPPGATVLARPFQRKDGVTHARRQALLQAPPDAVTPRCALFGECGGCVLQELPLHAQRAAKQAMVLELMGDLTGVQVLPMVGDSAAYGYRNKLDLTYGARRYLTEAEKGQETPNQGAWLGFHAPGRFDKVVDCPRCELAPEAMNEALAVARARLAESALPCWDSRANQGFWRHLVMRSTEDGQLLLAVYTAPPQDEALAQAELNALAQALPEGVSLVWFVNERSADAALGEQRAVLKGQALLTETLAGQRFSLSPTAFFQTNTRGAEVLVAAVAEALGSAQARRLLDLYCGTGALGLALSGRVQEVLGVELNAQAVEDARVNAALNGRENVQFIAGAVEDVLPSCRSDDMAVVDPPRSGLHPRAAAWLAQAPFGTLVYVACNPASLARDRVILEAGGWVLRSLRCVDLFPQTGHIEVVGGFSRA